MLTAALPVARALGIDPALLTCDAPNIASRKVIEANGGALKTSAATSSASGCRHPTAQRAGQIRATTSSR